MGLKVGRNANQFTFSTKFPRKPKKIAFKPKLFRKPKDSYTKFAPKLPFGAPKSPFIKDKLFHSLKSNLSSEVNKTLTKRENQSVKKDHTQTKVPSITPAKRVRTRATRRLVKKPIGLKKHKNLKWDPTKELANISSQFDFKAKDFTKFGLVKELTDLKYAYPSKVQVGMITRSLKGGDLLVGAQTGTGKTLGYLLPLFNALKVQERAIDFEVLSKSDEYMIESSSLNHNINSNNPLLQRKLLKPRSLILLPSRQLVGQVTGVAKDLTHECKLRVVGIHSKTRHVNELLEQPVDVLVTTPATLLTLISEKNLSLSKVFKVVYDEVDTLLDKSFEKTTLKINSNLKQIQKILITATVSQPMIDKIKDNFGDIELLIAPTLHKTPSGLHQEFIVYNQSTTKFDLLRNILKRGIGQTSRVLIFCNTTRQVENLFEQLKDKKYPVYKQSGEMNYFDAEKDLKEFFKDDGEFKVLVTSDVLSRGLDTDKIGIVVNYDFPTTVLDYVHRVGRTARFGEKGRAFSIIGKKDLALADRIKEKVKRGLSLSHE